MKPEDYGFSIIRERNVPELEGTLIEYEHIQTGAKVVWLRNTCENKVFKISFKTPPKDETGVFHIIEHCVFGGTEKYPVKELIRELRNGSLCTSLNAFTSRDNTSFPIVTHNNQDYINLVSVYLDAVFAPAFLNNSNIFLQEGWHLDIADKPSVNGIVYNEMKGIYSKDVSAGIRTLASLVFPDTCYGKESGGHPNDIPTLTYETLVDTYRKHYHPSNAYVYLDGTIPIEETFKLLNGYFSRYTKREDLPQIEYQAPQTITKVTEYEVREGESKKNMILMGKIICSWEDRVTLAATDILCTVLTGSNSSLLRKPIIEAGLAEDFGAVMSPGVLQPYLTLHLDNVDEADTTKLLCALKQEASTIIASGIPKEALTAAINRYAFDSKEITDKQSIDRADACMRSFLYDGDPLLYLTEDRVIQQLREMAQTNQFEILLQTIVESDGWAQLIMRPSTTIAASLKQNEDALACRLWEQLGSNGQQALREKMQEFACWQSTPDSREALASIPHLTLSDFSPDSSTVPTIIREVEGVPVLHHELHTNGISYIRFYFNLSDFSLEELSEITAMSILLAQLPTSKHSASELTQEIMGKTGGISFNVTARPAKDDSTKCMPYIEASLQVLNENVEVGMELLKEILCETQFNDRETIRQILFQVMTASNRSLMFNCISKGITAIEAQLNPVATATDATEGLTSIKWINDFCKEFDSKIDNYIAKIKGFQEKVFCRARLTASISSNCCADISQYIASLPLGSLPILTTAYVPAQPKNIGVCIPGQTSNTFYGYCVPNWQKEGMWSIEVATALCEDYLHEEIRVKGGAYGATIFHLSHGVVIMFSFSDPSPAMSLAAFKGVSAYLQNVSQNLEPYIISTIAILTRVSSPAKMSKWADGDWFSGRKPDFYGRRNKEILSTTTEQVKAWAKVFEACAESSSTCVIGEKGAISTFEGLQLIDL